MAPLDDQDEALSLALAAFHGAAAEELLGSLVEQRATRCRERLRVLTAGSAEQRRARLAAAFRERFSPPTRLLAETTEQLVARLVGEPPALVALALADLPASRAAQIASRLGVAPSRPAAPAVAVSAWVRKRLGGDLT